MTTADAMRFGSGSLKTAGSDLEGPLRGCPAGPGAEHTTAPAAETVTDEPTPCHPAGTRTADVTEHARAEASSAGSAQWRSDGLPAAGPVTGAAEAEGIAGAHNGDRSAGGVRTAADEDVATGGGAAVTDPTVRPTAGNGGFLARAAALTALLTAAGALLGLVRDQTIAHLYGADAATDAFLVSWTVPEFAGTLLIEDAMALVLVPAFSLALARRAAQHDDPVRDLLGATLPRLAAVLAAVGGLLLLGAPLLVGLLAPGLADQGLAVDCTRLTATTVFTFGIVGYFSAALRAHHRFWPPAAIYVAYNAGIIVTMMVLHGRWGVRAAAAGVAFGGLAMVLLQLPSFVRNLPLRGAFRRGRPGGPARSRDALLNAGLLAPVVLFALTRQSQVLVERFFGSALPPGAISHLNYAQKVAQMPMVLSLMVCTVTFPVVARALADGDHERARHRIERDLMFAAMVVLAGAAAVFACAPGIVEILFQRGAFDAGDTAATASVMRVYVLGLLGHSLVGVFGRAYFSAARPTWFPAWAMGIGLTTTVIGAAFTTPFWGVHGIAAANAAGITVTAMVLLRGLRTQRRRHAAPRDGHTMSIGVGRVAWGLARLVGAAAIATAAAWGMTVIVPGGPVVTTLAGCLTVTLVFPTAAIILRAPEVPRLLLLIERRLRHDRCNPARFVPSRRSPRR
ncbi:lipid II flippase MurJ [Streptomyces sp. NPDC001978]|uniref:lipid II flippase MurJ n=1 Tax=Streptomyces sp. NPDC001978 TaxID=3364627 RepID=UPI003673F9BC